MEPASRSTPEVLAAVRGRRIVGASSSLTRFAVALDDGQGLLAEAGQGADGPTVAVTMGPASALPALEEAVCAVDWGWIVGATVCGVALEGGRLRLDLDPVGPLTVSAALWQGAPFLAFQPYRPARENS